MEPVPQMRASDAEREATTAVLRAAASEGRLTLDELSERAELAYASKTRAELAALVADLPIPPPVQPSALPKNPYPQLALVFGIASLFGLAAMPLGVFGPVAVALGYVGLAKIRRGYAGDRAVAKAGIFCGLVATVLLSILFTVVFGVAIGA